MPKYLIKFIKEEHLKDLLEKGLYMNPAGYYALIEEEESKRVDKQEGLACSSCCAYKNRNRPVWCCTAIEKDDIVNNIIKLDKRIFSDFFGNDLEKGRLVFFEYETFLKSFIEHKDKYRSAYGHINYLEYKYFKDCIGTDNWSDCIFRKDISYSYQKEFRIAIDRECERIFADEELDGMICKTLKSYKAYFFPLPELGKISKVYNVNELSCGEKDYFLHLSHLKNSI